MFAQFFSKNKIQNLNVEQATDYILKIKIDQQNSNKIFQNKENSQNLQVRKRYKENVKNDIEKKVIRIQQNDNKENCFKNLDKYQLAIKTISPNKSNHSNNSNNKNIQLLQQQKNNKSQMKIHFCDQKTDNILNQQQIKLNQPKSNRIIQQINTSKSPNKQTIVPFKNITNNINFLSPPHQNIFHFHNKSKSPVKNQNITQRNIQEISKFQLDSIKNQIIEKQNYQNILSNYYQKFDKTNRNKSQHDKTKDNFFFQNVEKSLNNVEKQQYQNKQGQKSAQIFLSLKNKIISINDFKVLGLLGKGSFGQVYLVSYKNNKYAMKVLEKQKIFKNNLQKYVKAERNVMQKSNNPFIVKLHYAFQTSEQLFLVMQYAANGDLSNLLSCHKRLSEVECLPYFCELIVALEYLHSQDFIYRDLKPENIVIGSDGHIMLADFGLSKEGVQSQLQGGMSFCGSIAYLAPEMLSRQGHGKSLDWYIMGVVFYEMLTGLPPYYSKNQIELYSNIQNGNLQLPDYLSPDCKSLLSGLLQKNPRSRLGSFGSSEIKSHKFFQSVDWNKVYKKEYVMMRTNGRKIQKVVEYFDEESGDGENYIEGWYYNCDM